MYDTYDTHSRVTSIVVISILGGVGGSRELPNQHKSEAKASLDKKNSNT